MQEELAGGPTARRERIIVAALSLIRGSAGASVQMRDVAEQAKVALATLYRYFPSRDELLAFAYERWREECWEGLSASDPAEGETDADRFRRITHLDFRFLEREPHFCEISTTLSRISTPTVVACMRRIRERSYDIYLESFRTTEPADAMSVIEIFAAVMESQANQFVTGRITAKAAYEAMDRCIYMLLIRSAADSSSSR